MAGQLQPETLKKKPNPNTCLRFVLGGGRQCARKNRLKNKFTDTPELVKSSRSAQRRITDKIGLIRHSPLNFNLAACRRGRVYLLPNRLTDFTARQIEIYTHSRHTV